MPQKYFQIRNLRSFVLNQLRSLNINKGLVIEGRDIGSVVFPNANYKFFFRPLWTLYNILRNSYLIPKFLKRERVLLVILDFQVFQKHKV